MKVRAYYALEEPDYGNAALPDTLNLELMVSGSRMLGEIYLPSGIYEAPHPCVIVCHGIPGTNCNDDICQSLRRMGCVVMRLYHRGAWGSEGFYSYSHCIEDAEAVLAWIRAEAAATYKIDRSALFLLGHSNGGNTIFNAGKKDPSLRGLIAYCPFNHKAAMKKLSEAGFWEMLVQSTRVLHVESNEALYRDSLDHQDQWDFEALADPLKNQNILLIGGTMDTIAPPDVMIEPFWNLLQKEASPTNHQYILLPSNHSMDTCRLALIKTIAEWIEKILEET
jgi:dienelactone hydrolase